MCNAVKWPNILQKSCDVNTARFLKYVWPFYNIMHESVKGEIWSVPLHYMTSIQNQKIQAWRTSAADVNLEIKIPGTVLNKIFLILQLFLQYNFINDEMFKEETLSSKNTAKFKDFTMPNRTSSRFFVSQILL